MHWAARYLVTRFTVRRGFASWARLAVAVIAFPLTVPVAHAEGLFDAGGVPVARTTTVTAIQTVAGINNEGHFSVKGIGNGPTVTVTRGDGITAPVVDVRTVVGVQTVAGINNLGTFDLHGVANGGTAKPALIRRR
jgi:hypothetical protein